MQLNQLIVLYAYRAFDRAFDCEGTGKPGAGHAGILELPAFNDMVPANRLYAPIRLSNPAPWRYANRNP